jgi:4-amino-4-deoxy-L-arabinose transferase-like glycosyltransferase
MPVGETKPETGLVPRGELGIRSAMAEIHVRIVRDSRICLILLLAFSAVLNVGVALRASVTTDEPHHINYGGHILQFNPDRLFPDFCDSQMPISALNAAPLIIAQHLDAHGLLRPVSAALNHLGVARVPTILATLALDLLVYFWAFDLYGEGPALAACLLCTLSPNLIAHGTLATTDMYHALGVVGSLFFFHRYLLQPTLSRAIISGLALALAQTTKSFAMVLYGVVFLTLALVTLRPTSRPPLTRKRALLFTAIAALWFVAIINVAFCFDRTFLPLSSYFSGTNSVSRIQQLPLLARVPVPFPYPFLQGLHLMKVDEETGRTFGNVYLLGKLGDTTNPAFHGFKSYYAVVFFYKEPIALQILFLIGVVWICRHRKLHDFIVGEGPLVMTATILVVWLSFFSRAQIGIRHILPALAVETIIAGAAFSNFSSKPWPQKTLLSILVLWLAGSVASYYPQMIPYTNEWVRDRRFAYRIFADSNLDWGQDTKVVDEFLEKNPDVIFEPPKPVSGRVLIRANRLTGVDRWDPPAAFLSNYKPIAQVGYALLLFVVPAEDTSSGPK